MRKVFLFGFIMMVVAAAGFSQALVRNTPHNLSSASGVATRITSPTFNGEICVFCHTPHGGSATAPLWNRQADTATYTPYDSSTMDTVMPNTLTGVSGACMSCHDGTVAMDNLLNFNGTNPAGSGTFAPQGAAKATYGALGGGTNNAMTGGLPFLGLDLSNDHPVGIVYDTAYTAQAPTEFNAYAGATIAVTDGTNTLPLYGLAQGTATVECASCHNPHNNTNTNFLRIANTNSAICYTCHIK